MATHGLPNSGMVNLDILKNSSLQGAVSGMRELTQYFIRRAETLVPVLEVPGGIHVDVVFATTARLGDPDTHLHVRKERKKARDDR